MKKTLTITVMRRASFLLMPVILALPAPVGLLPLLSVFPATKMKICSNDLCPLKQIKKKMA